MIHDIIVAMLLRGITHIPRPIRMDSDQVTYAWFDLIYEAGFETITSTPRYL